MYNEELKQQVIEARKQFGYSVPKLVEKFGVARPTIYLWLKEEKENGCNTISSYPVLTKSEEDRGNYELKIAELQNRVKELEEQNATLIKTISHLVNK